MLNEGMSMWFWFYWAAVAVVIDKIMHQKPWLEAVQDNAFQLCLIAIFALVDIARLIIKKYFRNKE